MDTRKSVEHYQAGQLREALVAALDEVRQKPTDEGIRGFLCELCCFTGDLERADRQLDALAHQNPELALGVALFRHLLRGEEARQQFYNDGRPPEFVEPPSAWVRLYLEASIHQREAKPGYQAELVGLLEQAESLRPRFQGVCNGQEFMDFRDQDDRTAGLLEVLRQDGQYFWIPLEHIEQLEFRAPKRPRDLLWRQAHLQLRGGPQGEVFLPTLYPGTHTHENDALRLGRMTDWFEDQGYIRGMGQRMFWVDGEERSILEINSLSIKPLADD